MPQKIAKNVFIKGMNLDADISYQPKGTYRECEEFRIVADSDATMGSLNNVKGNTDLTIGLSADEVVVGSAVLEDYIVLFTTDLNASTLPDAITLANNIKSTYNSHITDVTMHANGIDQDNGTTAANATDLPTLITLVTDLLNMYPFHNDDAKSSNDNKYHHGIIRADADLTSAVAPNNIIECIERLLDLEIRLNLHDLDAWAHNNEGNNQVPVTTVPSLDSVSNIYKVLFDGEDTTSTLIYTDLNLSTADSLHLDYGYPIKAVTRKEATDIEKVYWVDDNNYLRYLNAAVNLTTDGEPKDDDNNYLSAKAFGTVADIAFAEPQLLSSGGGGLNVGVVQYAYQLYNKNGSESSFSPATGLYHLSSSSNTVSNSKNYEGNDQGEESGKSFTFNITLTNYEFDSVRIVSIHYEYYSQLPTINIINEKAIPESGVVIFTDRGSNYIGSYTIEQFTALAGLYKARDLASSKNYLFLANTTENYFNIGEYDARTYRFRASDDTAQMHEGDDYYYKIEPNGDWEYYNPSNQQLSNGTNWSLPKTANIINWYNDPNNDGGAWAQFMFKPGTSTLGGVGKNVSYIFQINSIELDDMQETYVLKTEAKDSILGFDNYASPNISANSRSYQRDETYRFGIIFFDQYGRESIVEWIGDIRMPSIVNYPVSNTAAKTTGLILNPKFTVTNYPTNAVSYKIVRIERTSEHKSIVCSGIVRPTLKKALSETNNLQPFHVYHEDSMTTENWVSYELQEFISPEISFFKNLQVLGDDYIEIHDANFSQIWDPEHHNNDRVDDDCVIKIKWVHYADDTVNLTINNGAVVSTGFIENEEVAIGPFSFYAYYEGDNDKGSTEKRTVAYKGTSLIFEPDGAPDIYGVTGSNQFTDQYIRYGMYRRKIQSSQYGGNTYSSRALNEYIAASPIITIPVGRGSSSTISGYGDMFIVYHEQMALSFTDESEDHAFLNIMFPVESSINLNLRHDDRFTTVYTPDSKDYQNLREEGVSDGDSVYSEMYLYNTVYSQESTMKKYFPLPEGEEFEEFKEFSTRILVSEKKLDGEESDSWLSFLPNNFLDVDANYGELSNIMSYNNNLLYWQNRGFGLVDVDARSLIADNNPGALVLGTGGVLSRFDYLSTMVGNTDLYGLIKTPKGIYWYDNEQQMIIRYSGKLVERLSKILGVQSHLNEKQYTTCNVAFDQKYDEVLFALRGTISKTLVFNEMTNSFTSFYGFDPTRFIQYKDRLISSNNDTLLWLHDSANAEYGLYYGAITPNASTIRVLINEDVDTVKVFDAVNYTSYVRDINDVLIYDETFDTVRCHNSYQNTDYIDLIPGTTVSRKKGMWSFNVARNDVNVDPSTNPDIFASNKLGGGTQPRPRMRDTYMLMDLTYNNTNNYRFNVPFVHTKYRANFR